MPAHPPSPDGPSPPRGLLAWWRRWRGTGAAATAANPVPSPRRRQRERLALLVREVMIRHGVLSSRYRVRVLSLDPTGQQHLVLIDWLADGAGPAAGPTPEPTRLEAEIRADADQTLGLSVRAVYWRGSPAAPGRTRRDGTSGPLSGPRS